MTKTVEDYVNGLSVEEAQKELEFVSTECFISGYNTRLVSILNSANRFFKTPEQEEEKCRILEECIKRGGSDEKIPRRTPEDYRKIAEDSYYILRDTYEELPWEQLRTPDGSPIKPIYTPLVYAMTHIEDMESLLSEVFFDPRIVPPEHEKLKQEVKTLANLGHKFEYSVVLLERKIEKATGQKPMEKFAFEIHD